MDGVEWYRELGVARMLLPFSELYKCSTVQYINLQCALKIDPLVFYCHFNPEMLFVMMMIMNCFTLFMCIYLIYIEQVCRTFNENALQFKFAV
jgi:hypothetical protein